MSKPKTREEAYGWFFGFIKELATSLRENRRFYPKDDDIDKLKQLYQIIQNQPEVDEEFLSKWTERIYCDRKSIRAIKSNLEEMLQEAGVKTK